MSNKPLDPKELGYYFSLAQVGLEMIVPVVGGLMVEKYLGCQPWGVVGGAGLGLVVGLIHLVSMSNRPQDRDSSKGKQEPR
jgi:F0F1-type ATP synthase assembly protein I